MSDTLLAVLFSMGTTVFSATFSLVARRGQEHGTAVTGVVIGLIVNTPLLVAATWLLWQPAWWNPAAIAWFVAGGITGPCLGRVFMYQSIHFLGVSRAMPLMATLPLATTILAYIFLGERPGPFIWTGTFMVVMGCAGVTMKRKADKSWDQRYLWLMFVSILAFSISNVFRKTGIGMLPSPIFGVTITYVTGLTVFLLGARFLPEAHRPRLRWGKAWYFYGVCGLLNTAAFLFHFFAIRYGDLSIVTPLSSMSPIFALFLSWIFLRDLERVTPWILAGTVFAVAGGILIAWRIL